MKKLFTLLIALVAGIATMCGEIYSGNYDFIEGYLSYRILTDKNNEVEIVKFSSSYKGGIFDIPSSVTHDGVTYRITKIGTYAFQSGSMLQKITIPNSVTVIANLAFSGCSKLKIVKMPEYAEYIGKEIFWGCSLLPEIGGIRYADTYLVEALDKTMSSYSIQEGTKYIGYGAFENCTSLTSIDIPDGVMLLGDLSFNNCSNLESVTFPNSITHIEKDAFANCTNLSFAQIKELNAWFNISFASSKSNPLYYAHDLYINNELLENLIIPDGISRISDYVFINCIKLQNITFPNALITIGASAFSGCLNLSDITIPNAVTTIGASAFSGCTNLSHLVIPNSVTTIGASAFAKCTELFCVEIPGSVVSIGDNAFYGVFNIRYSGEATGSPWGAKSANGILEGHMVYKDETKSNIILCHPKAEGAIVLLESVKNISEAAFSDCEKITSITLPDGLDTIGQSAFFWCSALNKINLPNSLKSIGSQAFTGCVSLTSVAIPSTNVTIGYLAFTYVPNVEYPGDPGYMSWGARSVNGFVDGYWVYADNTKTTLLACSAIAEGDITVPASVTEMPRNSLGTTFFYCRKITSITIPTGVSVISSYAFEGCSSLRTVVLPNSITEIEGSAFNNCKSLLSFTCKATTPPVMGNDVFYKIDCSVIPLYVPAGSVDAYKAADQWNEFNPILPIEEGIDQITNDQLPISHKILHNGQILILRGDKVYTVTGQRL